jgi:hypothetical protein
VGKPVAHAISIPFTKQSTHPKRLTALRLILPVALAAWFAVPSTAQAQGAAGPGVQSGKGSGAKPPASASRSPAKPAAASPSRQQPAKVEAPVEPSEQAGPAQLEAAELVYYGPKDCDEKQVLEVARNGSHPGYVVVKLKNQSWTMKPIASLTGAVRLEDINGQTLLVQIPFKSMLMNVQSGQRMVDSCQHEIQKAANEEARRSPAPPGMGILSASPTPAETAVGAPAAGSAK